jgi:fibro-slime domain-containing protein
MLAPYLDATGTKTKLKDNQVIYLFELATTDQHNATWDMQDLVVLVDLATNASFFTPITTTTAASTDSCGTVLNDTSAVLGAANSGGIASAASFGQWFKDSPGNNVSARTFLSMTKDASGIFSFATNDFTPIDGEMYGNQGAAHNRGFTLSIDAGTTYKKCTGQFIEYAGSGDAWLFVNGKLVLDMGGTHAGGRQTVSLDRLGLTDGQEVRIQFFYAQRTSSNAAFALRTNMVLSTPNSVSVPGVSGIRD